MIEYMCNSNADEWIEMEVEDLENINTNLKAALAVLTQNKTFPADIEYAKKLISQVLGITSFDH